MADQCRYGNVTRSNVAEIILGNGLLLQPATRGRWRYVRDLSFSVWQINTFICLLFPQWNGLEWESPGSPWSSCSRRDKEKVQQRRCRAVNQLYPSSLPPHTAYLPVSTLRQRPSCLFLTLYYCTIRSDEVWSRSLWIRFTSDWFPTSGFLTVSNPDSITGPSFSCWYKCLRLKNTPSDTSRHQVWERERTQQTADAGWLPWGATSRRPVIKVWSSVFSVNPCCDFNALCQIGVNQFKSFNLSTLDALDFICFMFYSARRSAHLYIIKGSFKILSGFCVCVCVCDLVIRQMFYCLVA